MSYMNKIHEIHHRDCYCGMCDHQKPAKEKQLGPSDATAGSAWVDLPDTPGLWWKCFEGFAPHVVEISKHDVALFKNYGHDFRGPDTRIKYQWLPVIDAPQSFEPNDKMEQPPLTKNDET